MVGQRPEMKVYQNPMMKEDHCTTVDPRCSRKPQNEWSEVNFLKPSHSWRAIGGQGSEGIDWQRCSMFRIRTKLKYNYAAKMTPTPSSLFHLGPGEPPFITCTETACTFPTMIKPLPPTYLKIAVSVVVTGPQLNNFNSALLYVEAA